MSIKDNKQEYLAALEKAHQEFPLGQYKYTPQDCPRHDFSFIVFCDGGTYDIARCLKCGKEAVVRCSFDDDYD